MIYAARWQQHIPWVDNAAWTEVGIIAQVVVYTAVAWFEVGTIGTEMAYNAVAWFEGGTIGTEMAYNAVAWFESGTLRAQVHNYPPPPQLLRMPRKTRIECSGLSRKILGMDCPSNNA